MTHNLSLCIGETRVIECIQRKRKSVRGRRRRGAAYTAFIWLKIRSSATITENNDELSQAIPTICTYN
jgi:hypothetical protein